MVRTLSIALILIAGWTGRAAGEPRQEWVLPILVGGTPSGSAYYSSNLHLMNLSSTAAELEVVVFAGDVEDPASDPRPVPQEESILRLEAGEALTTELRLQELGDERPGFRQGWALFRAPPGVRLHLAVELTDFREDDSGALQPFSSVMVDAVRPARNLAVFAAWEGSFGCFPSRQGAYAFVNPSEDRVAQVEVSLDLSRTTGQNRTLRRRLEIPPRGRLPLFLSDLFSNLFPRGRSAPCIELFSPPSGVLRITSDVPIAVGALEVDLRSGRFVNLPLSTR